MNNQHLQIKHVKKINDYEYLNYGVAGYSLYQSFLKYKEVSKKINFENNFYST